MSFWEDASPLVKGAIVVFGLLIVYLIVAFPLRFEPWLTILGPADAVSERQTFDPAGSLDN